MPFQNKYVPEGAQVISLPHEFDHGEKRTILAFAKDIKQQAAALEAGADTAGGPDLVKKVTHSLAFHRPIHNSA